MHERVDSELVHYDSREPNSLEDDVGRSKMFVNGPPFSNAKMQAKPQFPNNSDRKPMKDGRFPNQRANPSYNSERKHFPPYWSSEDINKALEKGEAFRASFRVNAHNCYEAYCTVDGLPTDVLVNGVLNQNRAIEGDVVAIVVNPPSSWPRLKGSLSNRIKTVSSPTDVSTTEKTEFTGEGCEDDNFTNKALCEYNSGDDGICLSCENGDLEENSPAGVEEMNEDNLSDSGNEAGYSNFKIDSDSPLLCATQLAEDDNEDPETEEYFLQPKLSIEEKQFPDAYKEIIDAVKSFPNKRPTGKVVAILEESHRRKLVIGYLDTKQMGKERGKGRYSKQEQLNKQVPISSPSSGTGIVHLVPTDRKFPKMNVFVRSLPNHIKNRLFDGDMKIENELMLGCIEAWRPESYRPLAVIKESLGQGGTLESLTTAILAEHAIKADEFQPELLDSLPKLPWKIPSKEFKIRRDLRQLCIFSIDPQTARDLDDALSVERIGSDVLRIGVHIADVSYFVQPGTVLDGEARERSTSVYLIQKVIPMLPRLLCEELCSLNPGVDRLTFSIFWDINLNGEILDQWTGHTIIRSCCKLSYQHAQEIIEGSVEDPCTLSPEAGWPELHGHFNWQRIFSDIRSLHEVARMRRINRFENGALRLSNLKLAFLLDDDGSPSDTFLYEQKEANYLVEEFMLLANMTVAKIISQAFPESSLLRRHPEPNLHKLRGLETFCYNLGFEMNTASSWELHFSLEKLREQLNSDPVLFNIILLHATKPMRLAKYFCTGDLGSNKSDWQHYALATPLYTHFTSPIRRYPDIVVHRTLAAVIEAEETYIKWLRLKDKKDASFTSANSHSTRVFTCHIFNKEAAESSLGRKALAAAAAKHKILNSENLSVVAAYCNERKLAARHVQDASSKLFLWSILQKKQVFLTHARVLAVGPKFITLYVNEITMERRIYFDGLEGLKPEWLEVTGRLLLNILDTKHSKKRFGYRFRRLDDAVLLVNPTRPLRVATKSEDCSESLQNLEIETREDFLGNMLDGDLEHDNIHTYSIEPAVFPLILGPLSTVPVSLYAVGGEKEPPDVSVRLFASSYLR